MELLTAREFALKRGIEERYTRRWAKKGEVEGAVKVGAAWAAPLPAWEKAAAKERKAGRPKKQAPET